MRPRLQQAGLQLNWQPQDCVVTDPAGFARLFPATGGALYGRASHGWMASFRRPAAATALPACSWLVQRASGAGSPDGGALRPAGGGEPAQRPRFDEVVPPNGYRWWYIDALSADARHGLTIIGFVGSVFSPYYAWARRKGPADAGNHCAINVALYGDAGHRWSMTERGRGASRATPAASPSGQAA